MLAGRRADHARARSRSRRITRRRWPGRRACSSTSAASRPTAPLADAVLRYPTDVVRQIRVGRHPNSTVRVVLDLEGVKRHSVYTLYNPFRLVIECEPAGVDHRDDRPEAGAAERTAGHPTHLPTPACVGAAIAATRAAGGGPRPSATAARTRAIDDRRADRRLPPTVAATSRDAPAPEAPAANGAGGFSLSRQLGLGMSRIVIDPGHGGHDPGAQARGLERSRPHARHRAASREAASRTKAGIEVVLTRRTERVHPARGANRDRQSRGRRSVPLDPRQHEPQRDSARRRDLFPELRRHAGGRSRRRARELRARRRDAQAAGHHQGDRAQQQARRVARSRRHGAGVAGHAAAPLEQERATTAA